MEVCGNVEALWIGEWVWRWEGTQAAERDGLGAPHGIRGGVGAEGETPFVIGSNGVAPLFNDVEVIGGGTGLEGASIVTISAADEIGSFVGKGFGRFRELIDAETLIRMGVTCGESCPVEVADAGLGWLSQGGGMIGAEGEGGD